MQPGARGEWIGTDFFEPKVRSGCQGELGTDFFKLKVKAGEI